MIKEIKTLNKSFKFRFFIWLFTTISLLVVFSVILFKGTNLNTNILDLLPESKKNHNINKISSIFNKRVSEKVVFLIGNKDKKTAEKASDIFYKTINKNLLFKNINYIINSSEQKKWAELYFPYRLSLLSPQDKVNLENKKINLLEQSAIMSLYSPIGISSSDLLQKDPYFNFQRFLSGLPQPSSIELIDSRPMIHKNNKWYLLIYAQIDGSSYSLKNQNKIISIINKAKKNALKINNTTEVLSNGVIFYAKSGSDSAQKEISIIGIGSIIGIFLLVFFTFRSLSPIFLTLLSAAIGFMTAFVVVKLYFNTVYIFTLVFGASLIGISVDYAFFYYADSLLGGKNWNCVSGLKHIYKGITIGLLNVIIAYSILAITPFPGLKQLAVFSISGLTMSYVTVVCLFPVLIKNNHHKIFPNKPIILKFTENYLRLYPRFLNKKKYLIFLLIIIISLFGISKIKINDDVRQLQSLPISLKKSEAKIKEIINSKIGSSFYIIQAKTAQENLNKQKRLINLINKTTPNTSTPYLSFVTYLPTIKEQKQNYLLVKNNLIKNNLKSYLERIGMSKSKIKETYNSLNNIKFKPLTIDKWLNSPASKPFRFLWIGKTKGKTSKNQLYTSIVLLSDDIKIRNIKSIEDQMQNVTYINQAAQVSETFGFYRYQISLILFSMHFLLFVFLLCRYGLKMGFGLYLPPLFSCLIALSAFGYLSIPLTLFNLLALILVLGISTDYVIFFAETYSNYKSTMLATFLSAVSTILSFGLLCISNTAVIKQFGITVLIGITAAFILSPTTINNKLRKKNR